MNKRTWKEFSDSGMLWWTNRILHTFGWSIVLEVEDDGSITSVYPARTEWLGFPQATNDKRWLQFKKHMLEVHE